LNPAEGNEDDPTYGGSVIDGGSDRLQ
jgi:hypothetical protein